MKKPCLLGEVTGWESYRIWSDWPTTSLIVAEDAPPDKPRLLDQVRDVIRRKMVAAQTPLPHLKIHRRAADATVMPLRGIEVRS
jgi:hypothetical protein